MIVAKFLVAVASKSEGEGVSSISAGASSASTVPAKAMISVRRGSLAAFAAAGLLVAIGAGLLLATSDHLVDPIAFGLQVAVIVVGWFSAALYWLVRRPGNRLGLVLLALAVATAAISLQGATQPQLRSIGVLADWPLLLLVFYVIFAFPEGRIASRFGWALLGAMSLATLASYPPRSSSRRSSMASLPLAGCNAACPANGFMIADRPTIADGLFSSDITAYLPVRGLLRNPRLPDLPAGDGDAAAEAGTPACLRPGSDGHLSGPGLLRSPSSSWCTWMRARSRTGLAGHHRLQRDCHTDFCFRSW